MAGEAVGNIANIHLEKYELKKPDYDYIQRDYEGARNLRYAPARYKKSSIEWESISAQKESARIMFLGDITCFGKQFTEAQIGRGFDFSYEFEKLKGVFSQADLVVGNLETMIFPEAPYRNEKLVSEQNFFCNAPVEFLDAIRKAGIDALTNANNHVLDTGAVGIGETIDYIKNFGFIHTGSFKENKKRYELIDVRGFKIALIAFTTEFNGKKENLTEAGAEFLLNEYNDKKAGELIKDARANGAELVFVCIHWGTEHKAVQNKQQEFIAQTLVKLGCDCIIGSHPHVLQPFTILNVGGRSAPVFYSLGNFVSHNSAGAKSRSAIACIDMMRAEGEVRLGCSYIPIFTSSKYGEKRFVVLPINAKTNNVTNKKRLELIGKALGNELVVTKDVEWEDYVEDTGVAKEISAEKKSHFNTLMGEGYPLFYDDGVLVYAIHEGYACCEGVSANDTRGSFTIPVSVQSVAVKEIKPAAFEANQKINKVNFHKQITFIPERAFKNCIGLEGVQLGNSTTEIQAAAFENCVKLSAIVLKPATQKIGKRAFANCINLRSAKIPNYTIDIAPDAFECCPQVTIYCAKGSAADKYAQENNIPIKYLYVAPKNEEKANVPVMGPMNGPGDKHPAPIIAACYYLGYPLPKSAVCGHQPSHYLGEDTLGGELETIKGLLGERMPAFDEEMLVKMYKRFVIKYKTQKHMKYTSTDSVVYFCDWILFGLPRGFSHDNYFDFELYNKESDIRDTFLNEEYRNRVKDACNKPGYRGVLFNKVKFNQKFKKYIKRDWIDGSTCSFEEFSGFIKKHGKVFAKPINGTGGAGAKIISYDPDALENLYQFCKDEKMIVEEIIKQHPTLAEFNPSTLNTIRVNTLLCADGEVRVVLNVARFGRSGNVVDNFHGGGVGAIADLESGVFITEAINQAHLRSNYHPDSQKEFLGFQYPEWEKLITSVCDAAKRTPHLRHIGWDIAVTSNGDIEFVEGNSRANFDVLQSPDQLGRRFRYHKYIKEIEEMNGIDYLEHEPLEIDISGMEL